MFIIFKKLDIHKIFTLIYILHLQQSILLIMSFLQFALTYLVIEMLLFLLLSVNLMES